MTIMLPGPIGPFLNRKFRLIMVHINAEVEATMKKLEDMAYIFFGNNLVIGSHIRRQLAFLKEIVPVEMLLALYDTGAGRARRMIASRRNAFAQT